MPFRKTVQPLAGLIAGVVILSGIGVKIRAQGSVTVTFGNFGSGAWPAGPDYATDVLGDPWDFCNIDDISPDPNEVGGWTNFSLNSAAHPCMAGGTTTQINGTNDSSISMLFRGFYDVNNPGRNGRNFPIDSSRYQKL